MIKIYTVAGCSSSRKAKRWLLNNGITFKEINLLTDDIKKEDFLEILALTEHGTEEIVSMRSHAYKSLSLDLEQFSLNSMITIMKENRTILRRPLILDENRLQIGYNNDDIRKFLPRSVRQVKLKDISQEVRNIVMERDFQIQLS
ncbi:Spx/MgsR family RNA polymerase-binding regulatory protein [Lactococcus ileimucosae]|uniref:Spx/MgsR family RNA polymerase-binding regulatory protein n=1 Tax=Lactococcus ileimucosae TaxID=2941329 RepID=A0ABV4D2V9_9LACT|nr:Spx/MgsR family RNA polymerase-binding regulatory protein [Lactococcus ileimucosae]